MAYAALPHDAHDGLHNDPAHKLASASPSLPDFAFEDLAATLSLSDHLENDQQPPLPLAKRTVSDVLKSLSGSQRSNCSAYSYEVVEEDDYEQAQITPRFPKRMESLMSQSIPGEDVPARTASISRHLPLHNPTPGLQSLQGAYVKNVERLEDSAERISLAGSVEDGLQRIKMDMRRSESIGRTAQEAHARQFSGNSITNSIIAVNATARSGGYSPAGYNPSPAGSLGSQHRFSQRGARMSRQSNFSGSLPEPELEGRPLESAMVHSPPTHAIQPRHSSDNQRQPSPRASNREDDRPGTAASNDTYRQAQSLFTDFDGIHFSPTEDETTERRISLSHPPLARDGKAYREAQPGEKMVYYPAPVPVMLNMPKRLSKGNWAQREQRRSKALSGIPAEMRKSAAWLANEDIDAEPVSEKPNRPSTHLPPQLRASAFFESPGTQANVKLKHGSAVITLDSILDAAAHAPVSAFTDHPIVGHLGNDVYGPEPGHRKKSSEAKSRRRSSLGNVFNRRKSSGTMSGLRRSSQNLGDEPDLSDDDPERAAERSIAPGEDELSDDQKREGDSEGEGSDEEQPEAQHQLGFLGAPTTLLAELQMRKAQQKLRNRTAANAFPNGMHSTLLELDLVSQLQQRSRKQKHIALAWEDQEAVDKANYDDEDVPLGVLFPEKQRQNHNNINRPLGLMEKKELEENEPLSFRRARLRGEPHKPSVPPQLQHHEQAAPHVDLPGVDELEEEEEEEELEGETLAQRRKRMQEKKEAAAAQIQKPSLADDIANGLGINAAQIGETKTPEPEVEETLGQRRKRLQAEAERHGVKAKTSMGDLLRANPVGSRNDERQASVEDKINLLMNRRDSSVPLVDYIQAAQPASKVIPETQAAEQKTTQVSIPGQALVDHIQAVQPTSKAMPEAQVAEQKTTHVPIPGQPLVGTGLQGATLEKHWPGRPQMPAPRPTPTHIQTSQGINQGPFHNGYNSFGNMQGMQSMPNLHMTNMNGYGMRQSQQQMQYPFNNQNMSVGNVGLGMNNPMGMGMSYNPMMMPGQMQMPMQMPMAANMNMGMGMPMGYGMSTMNPFDSIGMGPPLTNAQRNTIDRWRQGIA